MTLAYCSLDRVPDAPPPEPPIIPTVIEMAAPPVLAAASAPTAAPAEASQVHPVTAHPKSVARPRPVAPSPKISSAASDPRFRGAEAAAEAAPAGEGNGMVASAGAGFSNGAAGPADNGDVIAAYLADVRARLQRGLRYPDKAKRVGLQGALRLRLHILADGTIQPGSVAIEEAEAHPLLVAGALETVRTVALKPPPLPGMDLVAPLHFRIE